MRVIDYAQVLQQATADGLRCGYPNSGAFVPAAAHEIVGWIGPDDASIRVDLPATLIRCPPPYAGNLARGLISVWQQALAAPVWLVPKSHWAYELGHAHQDWLVRRLSELGVDVAALAGRTDAAAIEFDRDEAAELQSLVELLLSQLKTSDYALIVPGRSAVVTLHHHQQVWWQVREDRLIADIKKVDFDDAA